MDQEPSVRGASPVRTIGPEEVEARLDPPRLVEALRRAFLDPPTAPERLSLPIAAVGAEAEGRLLVMPALRPGGLIAVKLVTVHPALGARPGGAVRAVVLVLDAATGEVKGLVDGHSLTLRRTAATSVLAARALARPESRRLAVIGAGAMAGALAEAYATAFRLDKVAVWARRLQAAEALAARLRAQGLPAHAVADRDAAVAAADIVTAATLSQSPLVLDAAVTPGTHVDLVGGFTPAMREADDALMAHAAVVVDGPAALTEAGDLSQPIAAGLLDPSQVRELAQVLREPAERDARAVTVFKSVGRALEDLAAAELLFERVEQ